MTEEIRKIIINYNEIKHLRNQVCMAGSNYTKMQDILDKDRKICILAQNEVVAVEEKIKQLETDLREAEGYWKGYGSLLDQLVDAYDEDDWDSIKSDLKNMSETRKENEDEED
jgi:hypothetical protein